MSRARNQVACTAKRLATLRANGRKPGAPKGSGGRPKGSGLIYGAQHAWTVLGAMHAGTTVAEACSKPGMPSPATVTEWASGIQNAPIVGFSELYAQARREMHDRWADQILMLSDESTCASGDMALLGSYKLRVDSRKWLLSKLRPELFGDKLAISGNSGAVVNVYLPQKGVVNDGSRVIDGQATVVEELSES